MSDMLKEQRPGPGYGGELDLMTRIYGFRSKTGYPSFCYFGAGV